jgi:hypothetical protein
MMNWWIERAQRSLDATDDVMNEKRGERRNYDGKAGQD